jgi:hypothetical protein
VSIAELQDAADTAWDAADEAWLRYMLADRDELARRLDIFQAMQAFADTLEAEVKAARARLTMTARVRRVWRRVRGIR